MLCQFNNLNSRLVSRLETNVGGQRNLRNTDCAWIGVVRRTNDLEGMNHRIGHVQWSAIWAVGPEAEVHMNNSDGMASKPAWLEGNGATGRGPVCTIARGIDAAA